MQSQHYWLNKTKFKGQMQKNKILQQINKNKVKKLQETYRYNEPIFLFIYTCTYSLKKPAHNCDEKIQIQFLVSIYSLDYDNM
jgi:hypothetical protein